MLKDRSNKKVITHRIAVGKPAKKINGQIQKGSYPTALDHLIITGVEEQPDGQFIEDTDAMARVSAINPNRYGTPDHLVKIPIRVDSDTISDFLMQDYAARRQLPVFNADGSPILIQGESDSSPVPLKRLRVWCKGDGKTAKRIDATDGRTERACLCNASPQHAAWTRSDLEALLRGQAQYDPTTDTRRCPFAQLAREAAMPGAPSVFKGAPTCKPETVLITRCDSIASIGVFARTRSHGHQTADRLASTLKNIQAAIPGGILQDIPLDLCLMMVPTEIPGRPGKKAQPVLHVELRLSPEDTQALIQSRLQQRIAIAAAVGEERRMLLAAARTEAADEAVEGEFTIVHGREGGGGVRT